MKGESLMQSFVILHTNDIHGRIEGLARIATMIEQIKADNAGIPVIYMDAGDIEERSLRVSSFTKGSAMHRLLSISGCNVAAIGNGGIASYGPQMLAEYVQVARYPLLLANLFDGNGKLPDGAQPTALLMAGHVKVGVIGVTATIGGIYKEFGFDEPPLSLVPLIHSHSAQLRAQGADIIILLSHLGLEADRKVAADLQEEVSLIIGAHSHNVLPEGERVGTILIAQAGQYAEYLGRLDVTWDGQKLRIDHVSVISVTEEIKPATHVLTEVQTIEAEIEQFLTEIVGELAEPLDIASDRECRSANLMADVLRERMHADVGIVTPLVSFSGPLPAGLVRRGALWEVCMSPANPGVVTLTGEQLVEVVKRGQDRDFASEQPRSGRGQQRGLLHLSGASLQNGQLLVNTHPVEMKRAYRVAGSDWEISPYGGYVAAEWNLEPHYDMPIILREALEEYLLLHRPVRIGIGRLDVLH
jgi:5'-nucleotidase